MSTKGMVNNRLKTHLKLCPLNLKNDKDLFMRENDHEAKGQRTEDKIRFKSAMGKAVF